MVLAWSSDHVPLCIDAYFTTGRQYETFLDAGPVGQGDCANETDFMPGDQFSSALNRYTCPGTADFSDPLYDQHPITCVDLCDAATYCAWAGKRLCGAIGGGPLVPTFLSSGWDPTPHYTSGEYYAACSGGPAALSFPYGNAYEASRCGEGPIEGPSVSNVSFGMCEGGFAGLHHMVHAVRAIMNACGPDEWGTVRCDTGGRSKACAGQGTIGGSYAPYLTPDGDDTAYGGFTRFAGAGIRCCADAMEIP